MRCGPVLLILALALIAGCAKDAKPYDYTLSGTISYTDRLYDSGGFDTTPATQLLPVRNAQLELVEEDSGTTLVQTTTDATGAYTLSARSAGQVYLRILAATDPTQAPPVEVRDTSATQIAATYHFTPAAGSSTVDVTIPVTNSASGAFNILDVMTYAGQFYQSLTGGTAPPLLKVFWSPSSTVGTGYCHIADTPNCPLASSGIYVCGACTSLASAVPDADEYDDDVLLHEYGHFVEDSFGAMDSPGGSHALNQTNLDLRLAWSEGWGDFFSGAAKAWINTATAGKAISERPTASGLYVDTVGDIASIAYDFSTAPSYEGVTPRYDTSEAAVAKVLHDLLSTTSMAPLWAIETGDFAATGISSTMEGFADAWATDGYDPNTLNTALSGRQIDFTEDVYEPNDSIAQATALTVGTPVDATLYSTALSPDVDDYSFQATAGTTYQVETCRLWNAADTQIRITDATGTTVSYTDTGGTLQTMSDDNIPGILQNYNDGVTLRSLLSFAAPATTTYYVEVTRSSAPPNWAGRYGNYTLSVAIPTSTGTTPCN